MDLNIRKFVICPSNLTKSLRMKLIILHNNINRLHVNDNKKCLKNQVQRKCRGQGNAPL